MKKIKVSIIVPVYNVDKYLAKCLESIIHQTLKDIEIICINDGSTDNSPAIMEDFASRDNRITVINKKNGGYASAINLGLENAKGEFILIVESDDFCDPAICESMYNKIKDSNADFITCDFYFLKANKLKYCKYLKEIDNNIESFSIQTLPYIITKQAYPWKNLYRKDFLKENNIKMLQDKNGAYEDQPWNATVLALAKKILYLNKPLYYYRLDATGSSTNNGSRKMINYIYRKKQAKDILVKHNLYYNDIKEYFADSIIGGCLFFFKRISFEYKEEYYNEMKKFFLEVNNTGINYKYLSKKHKKILKDILNKDFKKFYRFEIFKHNIAKIFKRGV